jgi:predicted small secreted protein
MMRKRGQGARTLLALAAALLLLGGCRTMAGLGEDLSALGQKMTSKAREKSN